MGKSKKKQGKAKKASAPTYRFYVVTPGSGEHGFNSEGEVGQFLRSYLTNGGDNYIVATDDGTPIDVDPWAVHLYSREEAISELSQLRTRTRDMLDQIGGFRKTKDAKANQAIAAGFIPVDVLKGHIHQMNYDGEIDHQKWVLTLSSFGPAVNDDSPLTRALVALTDHLGTPEVGVEETIGNPDDAAAVVTDLPDPLPAWPGADQ